MLLPGISPAQDQRKIDSLLALLPKCSEDTNKVKVLNQLSWEISYVNLGKGETYAEQGEQLAEKLHFNRGLAAAYHDLGSIYLDMGDFQKANLYLFKELRLIESGKSNTSAGGCYVELGLLYSDQNNFQKALYYDSLAVARFQLDKNLRAEAVTYINIGSLYTKTGQNHKALQATKKALALNQKLGRKEAIASAYSNIGQLYENNHQYELAYENIMAGYRIYVEEKLTYSIPHSQALIAQYYEAIHQPQKAICYLDSAIPSLVESGQKEILMQIYRSLSNSYEEVKDFKNAHAYHKLYSDLKDSIFDENKSKEITQNELKYEFAKKEQAEKMERDKSDAMAQQEIRHQNTIMMVMGVLLVVMLVFAFIVFRNYKQKQKINIKLEHVNALIQEKNKSITDSINYAKRIQKAILPSDATIRQLLPDSFVFLKPKDIVSGDFYWLEKVNGKILFSAVDCTGHGVPGALVSVVGHNTLNRCVKEFRLEKPSDILDKLNELVQETFSGSTSTTSGEEDEVRDGMDLSLCSLDLDTKVLEYAGANNPLWIIRNTPDNNTQPEIEEIKADKQPIGKYAERKPFTNHRVQLNKGDLVYIFSDGYADQFGGEKGKKFKYKMLQQLLLSIRNQPVRNQEKILLDKFIAWQDQLEQVDDVLIIGVRV